MSIARGRLFVNFCLIKWYNTKMKKEKFSIQKRVKSVGYAIKGIVYVLKSEHNMWVHIMLFITSLFLGIILKIKSSEWVIIIIAYTMLFAAECINTAVEYTLDHLHPDTHINIGKAKDAAAGAVLIIGIGIFILSCIIFIPKII